MHTENILAAIAIMERAKAEGNKLDMFNWQTTATGWNAYSQDRAVATEQELHACGNKACFAGYVAISPEWRAIGGGVSSCGGAFLHKQTEYNPDNFTIRHELAIAAWFDVPERLVTPMVRGQLVEKDRVYEDGRMAVDTWSIAYDKWWSDVTHDDVIAKLLALLLED